MNDVTNSKEIHDNKSSLIGMKKTQMETPVIRKSVIRTQPQKRQYDKLTAEDPDRKPSFTPPSSSKRIGNMWVAYDKETGRLIQRNIESSKNIRNLFQERISVTWNNNVKVRQASLKPENNIVKYKVSPENTISVRVGGQQIENQGNEEQQENK